MHPIFQSILAADDTPQLLSTPAITWISLVVGLIMIVWTLLLVGKEKVKEVSATVVGMLGIAAFLIVGSQWATFKISATGIEGSRAAQAAAEVADQVEQIAGGLEAVKRQVAIIADRTAPNDAARIRADLNAAPHLDLQKLDAARRILRSVR